jgi:biofilm PGA synthesis N-glycosyltransferase PgaC
MAHSLITLFGSSGAALDSLCVVIPAYNEELLVGRCVSSVLAAGVSASQIYVIDDDSTDRTPAVLSEFAGINVLHNTQRLGKCRSLQRLAAHYFLQERYEFMALLDADSHVPASYFDAVLGKFTENPENVLVCGTPRAERHNWITAFRAAEYVLSAAVFRSGQSAMGTITVAPGCASTYRTSLLSHLDWGGGTLVEDMDLTVQVHRKRLGRVAFAPDAVALTQDPQTIRGYVGQITRWYSGTWQVMRLHRLPFGGQRIDAEFALLVGEGLLYSLLMLLLPVFIVLWPRVVMQWVVFDQCVAAVGAIYCARSLRRPDVLFWWPSFAVFRFLNAVIVVKTFWQEIVRGRSLGTWFSVDRYESTRSAARAVSQENICA